MYISTYSILSALVFIFLSGVVTHLMLIVIAYALASGLYILQITSDLLLQYLPDILVVIKFLNYFFVHITSMIVIVVSFWMNLECWKITKLILMPVYGLLNIIVGYLICFRNACGYILCLMCGTAKCSEQIVKKID
jgi:hypothetical protein